MDDPTSVAPGAADPAAAPADAAPAGYCIEIHVGGDGQISVEVEPEAEEAQEEQGGDPAMGGAPEASEGTPVKGIKGAVELVMQIFQANGQMPDAGAGESDFDSGFNQDQSAGSKAGALAKRFA